MAAKKSGIWGFLRLKKKKAVKMAGGEKKDITGKPRRQIPNRQIPPDRPYALDRLSSELLLYTAEEFLDQISIICLKLVSKRLYAIIPKEANPLSVAEKLQLLAKFPPRNKTLKDHPHGYLCKECVKWHSLSSTAIWPAWKPENTFASFEEFAAEEPRACITTAVSSGRWTLRWFIKGDKDFLLCERCNGLYSVSRKRCSWHCEDCGKCDNRQGWSALCRACTALRGGIEKPMKYLGQKPVTGRSDVGRRPAAAAGSSLDTGSLSQSKSTASSTLIEAQSRKKCPRCLGWKQWDLHSPETCRCFDSASEDTIRHDGYMYGI